VIGGRGGARQRVLVCLAAFAAAASVVPSALAGTFQVNSAADGPIASANCDPLTQPATGTCTLRDALNAAAGDAGPNTIGFHVGTGQVTISPATPLPGVPANTTIDGSTQPGWAGKPLVVLDGSGQTGGFGLDLTGTADKLISLELIDFNTNVGAAVHMDGSGGTVEGSYIGTDASGTPGLGNIVGILVNRESNTIGGTAAGNANVISGNSSDGVEVVNPNPLFNPNMGGEVVEGNLIGVAPDGTTPLANGGNGVSVTMDGIDGGDEITKNTIAYNAGNGVFVTASGRGLVVTDNSIHDNAQLGIDMAPAGVDPSPKPAGGADESVSAPVLTSAVTTPSGLSVTGGVPSTTNSVYALDIYSSPSCDPSGPSPLALHCSPSSTGLSRQRLPEIPRSPPSRSTTASPRPPSSRRA